MGEEIVRHAMLRVASVERDRVMSGWSLAAASNPRRTRRPERRWDRQTHHASCRERHM